MGWLVEIRYVTASGDVFVRIYIQLQKSNSLYSNSTQTRCQFQRRKRRRNPGRRRAQRCPRFPEVRSREILSSALSQKKQGVNKNAAPACTALIGGYEERFYWTIKPIANIHPSFQIYCPPLHWKMFNHLEVRRGEILIQRVCNVMRLFHFRGRWDRDGRSRQSEPIREPGALNSRTS